MKNLLGLVCVSIFLLSIGLVYGDLVMPPGYRLETIADGLNRPSAMALSPDGRIFYLERLAGNVRVIENGKLLGSNFVHVNVSTVGEEGLLGIALHPQFAGNGYVYVYFTQLSPRTNKIVRYKADGNAGISATTILDNIGYASGGTNNGGVMVFGTDGKLYVTVGDMESSGDAQSDLSLKGKVLQIDVDTAGFPYVIYAKGFRSPTHIAANKSVSTIYATDNYVGSVSTCDETNVITSSTNYGWDVESCEGSSYTAPLQEIDPQIDVASITAYTESNYPAPKVCTSDPTEPCYFDKVCSNNPEQPCMTDKHCSNNPKIYCIYDKVCSIVGNPCNSNLDCQAPSVNPCVPYCGTGNSCVATCGTGATCDEVCNGACDDATTNPLFIGGGTNGKIMESILSGASFNTLQASGAFYIPSGSNCPVVINDLEIGTDGWMYVLSDDPTTSKAGIYRLRYDADGRGNEEPREVSASPYVPLTVAKDGSGLRLWWEDLKKDVWKCSDENGDGTCDVPGEKTKKYTIWSGTIGSLPTYDHTALAQTDGDGTSQTDALLSYGIGSMPGGDVYYLVSGRAANREGTTGYATGPVERPGYDVTASEICNVITWGNQYHQCAPDWPDPALPTGSQCSPDEPGFPDQYNKCHRLHDWRGKIVLMDVAQFG